MRRFFAFLLAAAMLFSIAPTTAAATNSEWVVSPDIVAGDIYYTLDDDGLLTVYSTTGTLDGDIGYTVEKYSDSVKKIKLSDTITSVAVQAFDGLKFTGDLIIGKNVSDIGGYAFARCADFTLGLDDENTSFCLEDGVLYSSDMKRLVYASPSLTGEFTVPASVTTVCDGAFSGSKFEKIVIPDTVTDMMSINGTEGSFGRIFTNSAVKYIEIGKNVKKLGHCAIYRCSNLETVTISGTDTEFEDDFVIDDQGSSIGTVYVMPNSAAARYMHSFYSGKWEYIGKETVTGTISFPSDAYLENGSLIVDVWAEGQTTENYEKVEFEIDSLQDAVFKFPFPADETAVSIRIELRNLSGADTNLYTGQEFYFTGSGVTNSYSYSNTYVDIATLASAKIEMPCAKMISGTLAGDNLQAVDHATVNLRFGNYWTRAVIDPETLTLTAPMPYGITAGEYTPYIEVSEENATSNMLQKNHYYDGTVTVDPTQSLTNLNFTVETGCAVSGKITIPENAVVKNCEIRAIVEFYNDGYYVTGLTTKPLLDENNRSIPFMFGVDKTAAVTSTVALSVSDGIADDMLYEKYYSNVFANTTYYYSNGDSTLKKDDATSITVNSDIKNIDFALQTGTVYTAEVSMPESTSERYIWYSFYVVSADGEFISETSGGIKSGDGASCVQTVVPTTYDKVHVMYKVEYDSYGAYPDLYTGKAYINSDGTVTGFRSKASTYSTKKDLSFKFELAKTDDVSITGNLITADAVVQSPHPYTSSATAEYTYDGSGDGAKLKVTFSPLSWVHSYSKVKITDSSSSTATVYTADEFNQKLSGETIELTGPEFTVELENTSSSSYWKDYGFAIIDVVPASGDAGANTKKSFDFKVYDDTSAAAKLIPIEGATVKISDGQNTSISKESDASGVVSAELTVGKTYTITASKTGYAPYSASFSATTENAAKTNSIPLRMVSYSSGGGEDVTFYVKDGDDSALATISGASLTFEDKNGNTLTAATDTSGKATAPLDNGEYYVTVIAQDFKTRSFKVEISDKNYSFTVYLNRDEIIKVHSTVKEMSLEEIKAAGINTDDLGNKQVYKCTAVLSFMPDVTVSYCCSNDGEVLKTETVVVNNVSVTPVAKDIYLIVKSATSWLKETFDVQIVCDNTSAAETIKDLTASLTIPQGLSLAVMKDTSQSVTAQLGDVAPKKTVSHKWYIVGDTAGEYKLNGVLKGTRTGGGISEETELAFGLEKPITVLSGNAMKLTIDAQKSATAGKPYTMKYTLENVSEKTLYNLSFNVLGGKFLDNYGVTQAVYAREYGPNGAKDLGGNGFVFETEAFKPGEKISGIFTITFGEGLTLGTDKEWILKDAFVVTGGGSTTVIPTTVNWLDTVTLHHWNSGTVTTAATCTKDGVMKYSCTDGGCTETYTEKIPATGHNMGDFETTPPTCTAEGTETSTCKNTGCTHSVMLPVAPLGHDWSADYTVDQNPKCTTPGSKSRHCSRCSAKTDVLPIAESGHSMGAWYEKTPATCTSAGVKRRDCTACDYYETDTIAMLDHEWNEGSVTTPATEDSDGERTFTCKNCPATKTEPIAKLVKQAVEFARPGDITITYGEFEYVDNAAYNDSENGAALAYKSSNTAVATVDENGRAKITGAGEAIITATASATGIYAETEVSYKLTVNKKPLTITPAAVEIFYGETPKFTEYTASAFAYNEDKSVLEGEAVYTTDYNPYDKAATYKITLTGISAKNYDITFEEGTLTVNKAESYTIEFSNLSQRKGSTEAVKTALSPRDDTAKIKVEYEVNNTWQEALPTEIGSYGVRASLISAENIVPKAGFYATATLDVKAGAMITLDGGDIAIDTKVEGERAEFNLTDENVNTVMENIPANGEVVIDAKGGTSNVKELTLTSNVITALNESTAATSLTVLADDAEITLDSKALKTVAEKATAEDKITVRIDAVEKDTLNEKQQAALNSVGGDAVILELKLVITSYRNGEPVQEQVHSLGGNADVRAAYTLPADMKGKRVLVCYVADDGSVSYVRAKYDNGFVSFTTNHFSHYALVATACPHNWDGGKVITPATTSSKGIKRYTCTLCDETRDEDIAKLTEHGSGGGGGGGNNSATCTVRFETNGGSEAAKISVKKNTVLSAPNVPVREGFTFDGWYTDESLTEAYDFSEKVTKSFSLYAKWTKTEALATGEWRFTDVSTDDWFFESVKYVYDNSLMNGVSTDQFAPNECVSRAMLVTILYRAAGAPEVDGEILFKDVTADMYCANAVIWARETGIVSGINENEFAPEANITREQAATIIYRYAVHAGISASENSKAELAYADIDEISDYAVDGVAYCTANGIMQGRGNNRFAPAETATRAEAAAIIRRFIEKAK